MRKHHAKKLSLSTESVRSLVTQDLDRAAGGKLYKQSSPVVCVIPTGGCTLECPTNNCSFAPTQCIC